MGVWFIKPLGFNTTILYNDSETKTERNSKELILKEKWSEGRGGVQPIWVGWPGGAW